MWIGSVGKFHRLIRLKGISQVLKYVVIIMYQLSHRRNFDAYSACSGDSCCWLYGAPAHPATVTPLWSLASGCSQEPASLVHVRRGCVASLPRPLSCFPSWRDPLDSHASASVCFRTRSELTVCVWEKNRLVIMFQKTKSRSRPLFLEKNCWTGIFLSKSKCQVLVSYLVLFRILHHSPAGAEGLPAGLWARRG